MIMKHPERKHSAFQAAVAADLCSVSADLCCGGFCVNRGGGLLPVASQTGAEVERRCGE